jgi:addiction module HigA family antidote
MKKTFKITANILPAKPTHPGMILQDEMKERQLTQKQLSDLLGVSQPLLSEIINQKRRISIEMALKLESVLETPAETWLNLQKRYDYVTTYQRNQKLLEKLQLSQQRKKTLLEALA